LEHRLTLPGNERNVENRQDFESLVREHQSMVFSLSYHFLGDAGLAEEVAQDVLLSLYRNLGSIQSAEHAAAWLRRVTVQRSIDEGRKRRRRPRAGLEDSAEPAAPSADLERSDILRNAALWRMVSALPDIARMVVILRYQEDLSPAEIATALDRPLATVKSDLQRALALLREKSSRRLGGSYA
jgi:RNA polymerase sigma-70 factor (ECF subfamily)